VYELLASWNGPRFHWIGSQGTGLNAGESIGIFSLSGIEIVSLITKLQVKSLYQINYPDPQKRQMDMDDKKSVEQK